MTLGVKHHVLRLEITVDDAALVQALDREQDFGCISASNFFRQTLVDFEQLG